MPTEMTAPASIKAKLHHSIRETPCTVDIVPNLKHNSLMIANKFAHAQYITVLTTAEVLVYDDMGDLQRSISSKTILRGWRYKNCGLWRVPLTPVVLNRHTGTMLIYRPNPEHDINSAY